MHHETYIRRCFQLAELGKGSVAPNPLVGAVVVYNDEIIGEGYHQLYGGPHAEVNALAGLEGDSRLHNATIYVNLEPCAHHGKTPPCADLILRLGIPRVVVSNRDPFHLVNGAGIERLQQNGVHVESGVLEKEGAFLNRRFFTFHEKKRPYIILKWAESADGFLDKLRTSDEATINWITSKASRRLVHQWRSEEQAILVGVTTVLRDNPSLTVRDVAGKSPLRLVLGDCSKISSKANVFQKDAPTLLFHTGKQPLSSSNNAEVIMVPPQTEVLTFVLENLYERGIQSLIVEGGANTLQSFMQIGLWDEARVFRGTNLFEAGTPAPKWSFEPQETQMIDTDRLQFFYNEL